MEYPVTYFENMGKVNTDETLKIAKKRAENLGVKHVILSSSGYTAEKALKLFDGSGVILIIVGFKRNFPAELADKLVSKGHHLLYPSDYSFDHPPLGLETLRRFCEGMKVAAQGALMAIEAGLVSEGEEVISLGGTGTIEFEAGGGVDTAIVVEAVKGSEFFSPEGSVYERKMKGRRIKELLCKPR